MKGKEVEKEEVNGEKEQQIDEKDWEERMKEI